MIVPIPSFYSLSDRPTLGADSGIRKLHKEDLKGKAGGLLIELWEPAIRSNGVFKIACLRIK